MSLKESARQMWQVIGKGKHVTASDHFVVDYYTQGNRLLINSWKPPIIERMP